MRYYSLFGGSGQVAGRAWRRAAVTAVAAVAGVSAGLLPAQAAQASRGHQPPVFHPSRVVYGSVPTGQARDRWFTLVNSGRAVTGRLTFKITGRGASGFTLRRNHCASVILPPGGSCSGLIRFAPGHAARYRARLTARAGKVTGDAILPLTGIGTGTAAQARSISAGADHTCAVKTDGTLWCWGDNSGGQLGDGTTADSSVPVQVSGQATDWATVSAGYNHTCAVKTDGTLWCWGDNSGGQLGDGTTADSSVPVQVSGQATDWATVSAGGDHTCAIKTDHTLWCWATNTYGQLGDGTTADSSVPVQVSVQATDWATVSAGYNHTCAVKTDGTLWCWGDNSGGQLGDGTEIGRSVPVQVNGQANDWATVSAGFVYTCAAKTDHTVWCWGENVYGQLGNDTTDDSSVPVQVFEQATDWATVSTGQYHTCAVKTGGTLWCWGNNTYGQLGDGTATGSPIQVEVSGQATDWTGVSAGYGHTCAVKTNRTVWCWGHNGHGQLGNGLTVDSPVPVHVTGM
jgi:hypothetical protein